jgi:hypothetical protein
MDPSLRILMEVTYEAIADAGTNVIWTEEILFTNDMPINKACYILSFYLPYW